MKDSSKKMQALKAQVNAQIERMRRDFNDNEGFKSLQRANDKSEGKLVSMNLKDNVQPTYGVEIKTGEGAVNKGPDY